MPTKWTIDVHMIVHPHWSPTFWTPPYSASADPSTGTGGLFPQYHNFFFPAAVIEDFSDDSSTSAASPLLSVCNATAAKFVPAKHVYAPLPYINIALALADISSADCASLWPVPCFLAIFSFFYIFGEAKARFWRDQIQVMTQKKSDIRIKEDDDTFFTLICGTIDMFGCCDGVNCRII